MAYVILQKNQLGSYGHILSEDDHLDFLGFFLITDGFSFADFFLNWLKKLSLSSTGGDVTFLEKRDGYIVIEQAYDRTDEEDNPKEVAYFKTTKDEMISILEQWIAILNMDSRPSEVKVEQDDNGKVTLIPSKD